MLAVLGRVAVVATGTIAGLAIYKNFGKAIGFAKRKISSVKAEGQKKKAAKADDPAAAQA